MKKWAKRISLFCGSLTLPLISASSLVVDEIRKNKNKLRYKTFINTKVGFGGSLKQAVEKNFFFAVNPAQVKSVKMFIKNYCGNRNCDEWDRFANVMARKPGSEDWIEIGRFITPYWVGFEELRDGLVIDVTDFRSLLSGETQLRIFTETWLAKGRVYSVDFEFTLGEPKYKYSVVVPIFQYNKASIGTIPYGKESGIELKKDIEAIPKNVERAFLRSVISGWGHATPRDEGGRGCSEWCFRTHSLLIDGKKAFEHHLGRQNCYLNPVRNQLPGNWSPDRAGWCPGMEVYPRRNVLSKSLREKSFNLEYKLQEWKNDGRGGDAFYSLSTYLILESNSPIELPASAQKSGLASGESYMYSLK